MIGVLSPAGDELERFDPALCVEHPFSRVSVAILFAEWDRVEGSP